MCLLCVRSTECSTFTVTSLVMPWLFRTRYQQPMPQYAAASPAHLFSCRHCRLDPRLDSSHHPCWPPSLRGPSWVSSICTSQSTAQVEGVQTTTRSPKKKKEPPAPPPVSMPHPPRGNLQLQVWSPGFHALAALRSLSWFWVSVALLRAPRSRSGRWAGSGLAVGSLGGGPWSRLPCADLQQCSHSAHALLGHSL